MEEQINMYWSTYTGKVFEMFYLEELKKHLAFWNNFFNWAIAILSSGSLAALAIWQKHPEWWVSINLGVQIFSLYRPHLFLTEKIISLGYMIPEVQRIVNDMEKRWSMIDDSTDSKRIATLRHQYIAQYNEYEAKYLQAHPTKSNKRINKKAWNLSEQYLKANHIYYRNNEEVKS